MRSMQALNRGLRQYALQRRPDLPTLKGYRRIDAILTIAWTALGTSLLLLLIVSVVAAILTGLLRSSASWLFSEVRSVGFVGSVTFASCGLLSALLLFRFRWPILRAFAKFTKNVLSLIYYAIMVTFYVSAFATLASFIDNLSGHVESFLTSPIGIKPDYIEHGFVAFWLLLCGITAAMGFAHWVLRAAKREWESEVPTADMKPEHSNA